MTPRDFYTDTAELVAVLLPGAWRGLGPAAAVALAGLDTTSGPVLDVGAGPGDGVRTAARALPDAEVLAVEPDRALRTALLASVAAEPDLAGRVTVLDTDLAGAVEADLLPDRFCAVLLMNVLGHFSADGRRDVWTLLGRTLAPTGKALLTLYPPTTPQDVASTPMAETRVGRRHYRGWARAEASGPDSIDWEMTYEVRDADGPTSTLSKRSRWTVVSAEEIAEELRPHGLTITEADPEQFLYAITRALP